MVLIITSSPITTFNECCNLSSITRGIILSPLSNWFMSNGRCNNSSITSSMIYLTCDNMPFQKVIVDILRKELVAVLLDAVSDEYVCSPSVVLQHNHA